MSSVPWLNTALTDLLEDETWGLCETFSIDDVTGAKVPEGEPSTGSYATVAVAASAWATPARDGTDQASRTSNDGEVTWPTATASWGTLGFVIIRRASDSLVKDIVPLTEPVTVDTGDTVRVPIGEAAQVAE